MTTAFKEKKLNGIGLAALILCGVGIFLLFAENFLLRKITDSYSGLSSAFHIQNRIRIIYLIITAAVSFAGATMGLTQGDIYRLGAIGTAVFCATDVFCGIFVQVVAWIVSQNPDFPNTNIITFSIWVLCTVVLIFTGIFWMARKRSLKICLVSAVLFLLSAYGIYNIIFIAPYVL